MRRLRLQMQVSVDGFVATGPNDDQRWVTWAWDEIRDDVIAIVSSCDTILLGRSLAEGTSRTGPRPWRTRATRWPISRGTSTRRARSCSAGR